MSAKLPLFVIALLLALGVVRGQDGGTPIAEDIDTLTEIDYGEDSDQPRDKRQVIFDVSKVVDKGGGLVKWR